MRFSIPYYCFSTIEFCVELSLNNAINNSTHCVQYVWCFKGNIKQKCSLACEIILLFCVVNFVFTSKSTKRQKDKIEHTSLVMRGLFLSSMCLSQEASSIKLRRTVKEEDG